MGNCTPLFYIVIIIYPCHYIVAGFVKGATCQVTKEIYPDCYTVIAWWTVCVEWRIWAVISYQFQNLGWLCPDGGSFSSFFFFFFFFFFYYFNNNTCTLIYKNAQTTNNNDKCKQYDMFCLTHKIIMQYVMSNNVINLKQFFDLHFLWFPITHALYCQVVWIWTNDWNMLKSFYTP